MYIFCRVNIWPPVTVFFFHSLRSKTFLASEAATLAASDCQTLRRQSTKNGLTKEKREKKQRQYFVQILSGPKKSQLCESRLGFWSFFPLDSAPRGHRRVYQKAGGSSSNKNVCMVSHCFLLRGEGREVGRRSNLGLFFLLRGLLGSFFLLLVRLVTRITWSTRLIQSGLILCGEREGGGPKKTSRFPYTLFIPPKNKSSSSKINVVCGHNLHPFIALSSLSPFYLRRRNRRSITTQWWYHEINDWGNQVQELLRTL